MKLSKRLERGAVVLATAALVALAPAVAMAAEIVPLNSVDKDYTFTFAEYGTDGTSWEGKDTTSSTYIRIDGWSSHMPRLYVDGAYNKQGSGSTNCTNGGAVRAPGKGRYEIHNGVYELGYRWARITCWGDLGPGSMYGKWSPDCQGDYTDLN